MPQPYTPNNHPLDEVISALQKTIRRAEEESAMYWALELVPKYEAYLWRRLCVIVQEDIGIANPTALLLVPSQRALYFEFRAKGASGSARLVLANTILLMCRSPKSRIADHFQCAIAQGRAQGLLKLDIPDYARDKHTWAGKAKRRGVEQWLDEGCVLVDGPADAHDPYVERARALWLSPQFEKIEYPPLTTSGKGKGRPNSDLPDDSEQSPLF
jgi:hypothetical protein